MVQLSFFRPLSATGIQATRQINLARRLSRRLRLNPAPVAILLLARFAFLIPPQAPPARVRGACGGMRNADNSHVANLIDATHPHPSLREGPSPPPARPRAGARENEREDEISSCRHQRARRGGFTSLDLGERNETL